MKRLYRATEQAAKGTYWDLSSGQRVDLESVGALPGAAEATYLRMSPAGMLLLGPLMGFLYAIFLPLIGILMVLKLAYDRLLGSAFALMARSVSFGWRPRESYLEGKPGEKSDEHDEARNGIREKTGGKQENDEKI